MISNDELAQRIQDIAKSCAWNVAIPPPYQEKCLVAIAGILRNATRAQLQAHDPSALVACTVRTLFHYHETLFAREGGACEWKRRRRMRAAKSVYHGLLRAYVPEKTRQVTEAVVNAIHRNRLWRLESFCLWTMYDLLDHGADAIVVIHAMWSKLESLDAHAAEPSESSACEQDQRVVVRISSELFDVGPNPWPDTDDTVATVERILKLFRETISGGEQSRRSSVNLKKGIEACVRGMARRLSNDHLLVAVQRMCSWTLDPNTREDSVFDFGSTLEYTAFMHRAGLYENTLTPSVFPLLMRMIASPSGIISLLGNRVMQYLIDRQENRGNFDTPKIFFEDTHFDLKVAPCRGEDRLFLKAHREILHDSLLKSTVNHCASRMNLETTYCTICLIGIEVPCGFTAAALVCLAMNLQDLTLERRPMDARPISYHVHATVIAIMSLLCWIHKAKVFYGYVNKIMMERAQWAPHLNPPIQSQYNFAVHHVLWDKPELFFVDWEARYGLWKCFRLHEAQNSIDAAANSPR